MSRQITPQVMHEMANQAVKIARSGFSAKLDFSFASIARVEKLLDTIHTHLKSPASSWPESQIISFSLIFGGYLGEVLRREYGGEWETGPEERPVFRLGGLVLTPTLKVLGRLKDGKNDDICSYFQSLTQAVIPAMQGRPIPDSKGSQSPVKSNQHKLLSDQSGLYSVSVPTSWKSFERNNCLWVCPPDGSAVLAIVVIRRWIPFEQFVHESIQKKFQSHTPVGTPCEIDAKDMIGRRFEFTQTATGKTTNTLAYCLQNQSLSIFIPVSFTAGRSITEEARRAYDDLVSSIQSQKSLNL